MNQRMIEEQIKTHIGRKRLAAKCLAQDSQHVPVQESGQLATNIGLAEPLTVA
ncbi:hypothetical protein H8F24_06825 [Synechococcus sp. CBW1002]|uniref:hypothetical protein n=1 Tax=Synechococcus sp. CBW1002 TaxID=1353134 RepID=UPI0018CE1FC1|nr:hypothetical protein [Synechococcus sp. CBW1002]QPN61019.1 hypothetical protein H8F24_06825 [Synechococcus sp. CBW1002]